jgi:hypothetical protein
VPARFTPTFPATFPATFHEQRRVPWWWWVVALVVALPSVEIVVVFAPEMTSHGSWLRALVAGVITVAVIAGVLLSLSRSDVDVDSGGLRADRDVLPPTAIGQVRVLDRPTARTVLGRDARADAHLSIRPWVHTAVQIEVRDPADRTPYWVVGSRRPNELAEALNMLRGSSAGDDPAGAHQEASNDRAGER